VICTYIVRRIYSQLEGGFMPDRIVFAILLTAAVKELAYQFYTTSINYEKKLETFRLSL
jgi:Tfp pilus assembly protein PilO